MKNGYVTFVNDNLNYLKLCDILVESVINFSENPIEVFSINFDYKHSSEKVISRRIDLQTVGFNTICYSKLYSSINTSFDKAVQLDADFIITKQIIDNCFTIIKMAHQMLQSAVIIYIIIVNVIGRKNTIKF